MQPCRVCVSILIPPQNCRAPRFTMTTFRSSSGMFARNWPTRTQWVTGRFYWSSSLRGLPTNKRRCMMYIPYISLIAWYMTWRCKPDANPRHIRRCESDASKSRATRLARGRALFIREKRGNAPLQRAGNSRRMCENFCDEINWQITWCVCFFLSACLELVRFVYLNHFIPWGVAFIYIVSNTYYTKYTRLIVDRKIMVKMAY